jgi:hypothetical protein
VQDVSWDRESWNETDDSKPRRGNLSLAANIFAQMNRLRQSSALETIQAKVVAAWHLI